MLRSDRKPWSPSLYYAICSVIGAGVTGMGHSHKQHWESGPRGTTNQSIPGHVDRKLVPVGWQLCPLLSVYIKLISIPWGSWCMVLRPNYIFYSLSAESTVHISCQESLLHGSVCLQTHLNIINPRARMNSEGYSSRSVCLSISLSVFLRLFSY